MPGELGGNNWGGTAADPQTGSLFVRSHSAPTMHILSARPRISNTDGDTPEKRGRAFYAQTCVLCHGEPGTNGLRTMDKTGWIRIKELGPERILNVIRSGQGQMPPFPVNILSATNLQALLAYLDNPAAAAGRTPARMWMKRPRLRFPALTNSGFTLLSERSMPATACRPSARPGPN